MSNDHAEYDDDLKGCHMRTSHLYFYSSIIQVAGALVGFVVVAFTYGNQRGNVDPDVLTHTNRIVTAGGALLIDVVLAASVALFFDAQGTSLHVARSLLGAGFIPLTGGITYHGLWKTHLLPSSLEYRRRQVRGRWVTGISGVVAVLSTGWLLPCVLHRNAVGIEDLILLFLILIGGTYLGFLAFTHFMVRAAPERTVTATGKDASGHII